MMFKYFVRYEYTYFRRGAYWEDSSGEHVKETDSMIISSDKELDEIFEVQDIIKEKLNMSQTYFDIIAMNRL